MTHERFNRKRTTRPSAIDKKIGAKIKKLRSANGQSLQELASYLEVPCRQVRKYEAGQAKMPVGALFLSAAFLDGTLLGLFSSGVNLDYSTVLRKFRTMRLMMPSLQIRDIKMRRKFFEVRDEYVSSILRPDQHEELS